jgi:hypothetical protein
MVTREVRYDVIVVATRDYNSPASDWNWRAYANPTLHSTSLSASFLGVPIVPTTPELWERAIGLVVCGLATRYQK